MNAPLIGRTHSPTSLPDATPSKPASAPGKADSSAQSGPQADAKLNALSSLNGGASSASATNAASGKGKHAAFAMKPKTDADAKPGGKSDGKANTAADTPVQGTASHDATPAMPPGGAQQPAFQHAAPPPSAFAQQPASGPGGRLSNVLQNVAPIVGGGAGVLSAGVQMAGGVLQAMQAAEMAVAETIKNGAHNVEEASKPA